MVKENLCESNKMQRLCALALVSSAAAQTWQLVRLGNDAVTAGARCLDGSAGAYYIKAGVGENASKFVVFQQAGGWCMSIEDCYSRSQTALGSTVSDPATTDSWTIEDLLVGDAARNPLFYNWTSVYLRYCDGASRASNAALPATYNSTSLYFRGFPILRATIDALLGSSPGDGAPSLAAATSLVVAGGSAGGLAVFLHADYIAARVRVVNPGIEMVRAIASDGFFIDGASIWAGSHDFSAMFERVAALGNISTGDPEQASVMCEGVGFVSAFLFSQCTGRLTLIAWRLLLQQSAGIASWQNTPYLGSRRQLSS